MSTHEFIFSNQLKHKIGRHVAFWLVFSLHFIVQNLMIGGPGEGKTARSFTDSCFHLFYFLPFYLLSTYFFIEILLPRLLYRRKYIAFLFSFLLLFSISFIGIYYAGILYLHHITGQPFNQISFYANKYHALVDGIFVLFMLYGIAAGIKFSKKWYLQQRENEKLAKQKLATDLQLLKTSIHPRFLFHSLHTVQRHIKNSSAQSPALILQLSDLLSYILYENDKNWGLLERELEIIRYYINLEEKSYEGRQLFKTQFPENIEDKFIVPLLLLSLIENTFEYFLKTAQDEPFLTLDVEINKNVLHFHLVFSQPNEGVAETGLPDEKFTHVQRQLQNQYQGLHHWEVISDPNRVSVNLKLPLYSGDLISIKKNVVLNEIPEPV